VKNSRILAVSVIGLLAFSASDLFSQQPPQRPQSIPGIGGGSGNAAPIVALVDFERLMTNYVRSKYVRDQIRKDKEAAETTVKKESAELEKEKEKLRELRPGTPMFKALEEQLAQKVSEINVRIKILQRDFQEREQRSFYQLYTEISEEVKRFADAKGIVLVMPYSSEPVDPNVPETMQRQLSKSFVYMNGPDITEPILQELNRRAVQTTASRPGQAPTNPVKNPTR
jgi:Skp family chaperone for outer membrane proteins